ncbi:unnamed protein product [Litomosoides sigmodontis]|uniref:Uncharacterized protein n=1 Tax=Litomosoides sigmodontis TaxID=42156 RepID=A0A3P6T7Y4_LITSI|nr:unnamed protein product [Litomosoides sigmodontis]
MDELADRTVMLSSTDDGRIGSVTVNEELSVNGNQPGSEQQQRNKSSETVDDLELVLAEMEEGNTLERDSAVSYFE